MRRRRRVTRQTCTDRTNLFGPSILKRRGIEKMPGTALGASRNPWIQHLKASYQRDVKPKGTWTVEAAGADTAGVKRNLLSCNSEHGGEDPGRHATK